jgi:anti-anti-sigma factor
MEQTPTRIRSTLAEGGITVVHARGELDLAAKAALTTALISPHRLPPQVVVDLSGATFLDSSGCNALLLGWRVIQSAGGWLRLADVREPARSVMRVVGLDQVIPLYPTLRDALRPGEGREPAAAGPACEE